MKSTYPEDDDWILSGIFLQQVSECVRAGGEDDLVGLDLLPVAGDGHVHEVALLPQALEGGLDALLEVIPAQTELLF